MTNSTSFKVLAVCLGNICRSPLAEGLIQHAAESADLNWQVDSAGTGAWHVGNPPDPRSRAIAKSHGLDIDHQRAQKVTSDMIKQYDLVLAMDRKNYADLQQMASSEVELQKIKLLLDYVGLAQENGPDVFDPYWDDNGFEGVYQLIKAAAARLVAHYKEEVQRE